MARTRAKDYDDKRDAMLHQAAVVFARDGYDRASMAQLAAECGVSKALLYHYYASKEALLFAIVESHLSDLVDAVNGRWRALAPPPVEASSRRCSTPIATRMPNIACRSRA